MQVLLNYGVWSTKLGVTSFCYTNDVLVNLSMFFCVLVLHFFMIGPIRNGINMMRYVVYHYEEIEHPNSAFILGMLVVIINIFTAFTNIRMTMMQTTVLTVVAKFVAFKFFI